MLGQAQMGGAKPPIEDPDGPEDASPEEQEVYQNFVEAGMEVIMTPEGEPEQAIMETLKGNYPGPLAQLFADADPPLRPLDAAPIDPLAVAAVSVILEIENILGDSDVDLANEIVFHAGKELIEVLGETSENAKIHNYDENDLEVAFYRAIDLYRISSKRIDNAGLSQEFEQFVAANQEGEFAGLDQGEERQPQAQPQPAPGAV